jgi:eukaryotic-like serine/threonine-protein kinase
MNPLKRLIHEAHRRSLWQVLGIYLVGSWAIYQVVGEVTDRMGLPDWVPGFAIVLILIGLPVVLATAFVQEGAPSLRAVREPEPTIDPTLLPMDTPAAPVFAGEKQHLLFTWRKAVIGGVTAFLLLGITAGGYMGMRNAGVGPFGSLVASGALNNRERILIAEFAPLNGDSMLATTVTEAFRVDFAQSQKVTVVEPAHVRTVLQRMSRDVKSHVDAELAHEISVRDNIKAYLVGDVSEAGGKFVVAGKLVDTKTQNVLATYRETADDSSGIIPAVDRLSKKLRSKIGESLSTIRAEKPLEAVSTPSLEALQKYTEGTRLGDVEQDYDAAISLLQEAIELDSAFAMAWRKLAAIYNNAARGPDLIMRAAVKAYEFRDRLTDLERYSATGMYHYIVTEDWTKAISAYRMVEEGDPTWAPNNLGLAYWQIRDYEKAAAAFKTAVERDSTLAASLSNLVRVYQDLNDLDAAQRTLVAWEKRFGVRPELASLQMFIAAQRGDWASAEKSGHHVLELARTNPLWRARGNNQLSDLAAVKGQLSEAERFRSEAAAVNVERGNTGAGLANTLALARLDVQTRFDAGRAVSRVDAAVQKYPLAGIPLLNRPYLQIALLYAQAGQVQRARDLVAQYEAAVPAELRRNDADELARINGFIALQDKRFDDAIRLLRQAGTAGFCRPCGETELATAFDRASQPDSASAHYELFLSTPAFNRLFEDGYELAVVHERLAELYEAKGNKAKAIEHASKFVELWQSADSELQPRVAAKRELLRRLQGRG